MAAHGAGDLGVGLAALQELADALALACSPRAQRLLDGPPEGLAGAKPDPFRRLDLDGGAGLWVAADTSLARAHLECAEARELNALVPLEGHGDRAEQIVERHPGTAAAAARRFLNH